MQIMRVFFVYAGRRGSNLECAIALSQMAKKAGIDSDLVLSADNERAALVKKIYPQTAFADFYSPQGIDAIKKKLDSGIAFFTMISPKMLPVYLSIKSRKLFYFHATYDYSYSHKGVADYLSEMMQSIAIKNASQVLSTQPLLAWQIKFKLGVDAQVLPHPPYSPIDQKFFAADEEVNLPFGDYFLNFGEVSRPSKGSDVLLKAIDGTELNTVLVGKKEGVHHMSNLHHLNRWVSEGQLHRLIKNSSAVVLPYLLPSQFSGCLALAFHFKKPVLAPLSQSFEGWVEQNKTGWLFSSGDEQDLRRKMLLIKSGKLSYSRTAIEKKEKEQEKITLQKLRQILESR